jgi:hypothetical protein
MGPKPRGPGRGAQTGAACRAQPAMTITSLACRATSPLAGRLPRACRSSIRHCGAPTSFAGPGAPGCGLMRQRVCAALGAARMAGPTRSAMTARRRRLHEAQDQPEPGAGFRRLLQAPRRDQVEPRPDRGNRRHGRTPQRCRGCPQRSHTAGPPRDQGGKSADQGRAVCDWPGWRGGRQWSLLALQSERSHRPASPPRARSVTLAPRRPRCHRRP